MPKNKWCAAYCFFYDEKDKGVDIWGIGTSPESATKDGKAAIETGLAQGFDPPVAGQDGYYAVTSMTPAAYRHVKAHGYVSGLGWERNGVVFADDSVWVRAT